MKRKNLAIIYLFILSIGTILSLYIPKNEVTANNAVVIPNDAIRLRILANSDSGEDQAIKRIVRDEVNKEITNWVSALTSKEEAREVIKSGIPDIQRIAEQVLAEEQVNQTVKVEFGVVDFPTKLYGQFLYPAGQYEAILITLGEGVGANWWCVLFPPLCFLDFSSGVAVSEGFVDEEQPSEKDEKKKVNEQSADTKMNGQSEKNSDQKDSPEQDIAAEKMIEASASIEEADENTEQATGKEDNQIQSSENEIQKQSVEKTDESAAGTKDKQERPLAANEEVETKQANTKQAAPVYTSEDEEPVEVRFFVKEIWDRLFG